MTIFAQRSVSPYDAGRYSHTPKGGVEHNAELPGKPLVSETGGADSGALGDVSGASDPRLAELSKAWPTLPDIVKTQIITLIKSAG